MPRNSDFIIVSSQIAKMKSYTLHSHSLLSITVYSNPLPTHMRTHTYTHLHTHIPHVHTSRLLRSSDVRWKICPENFPMFFHKYNIIKYNNFTLLKLHYKLSYLL